MSSVVWLDERIACIKAHEYLAGLRDYEVPQECGFLMYGCTCAMNGLGRGVVGRAPCVFILDEDDPVWAGIKRWRVLVWPDGKHCVVPAQDAERFARELGAIVMGGVGYVR